MDLLKVYNPTNSMELTKLINKNKLIVEHVIEKQMQFILTHPTDKSAGINIPVTDGEWYPILLKCVNKH